MVGAQTTMARVVYGSGARSGLVMARFIYGEKLTDNLGYYEHGRPYDYGDVDDHVDDDDNGDADDDDIDDQF